VYVTSELTDCTFLGAESGGKYPSGLKFTFQCSNHLPEGMSETFRDRQQTLRNHYRIKLSDLCCVPGRKPARGSAYKAKSEKKEKKKKRSSLENGTNFLDLSPGTTPDFARAMTKGKDTSLDVYKTNICAACLLPMRNIQTIDFVNGVCVPLSVQRTEVGMKCVRCRHVVHCACVGVWPSHDAPGVTLSAGPFSYCCEACDSATPAAPLNPLNFPSSTPAPLPTPSASGTVTIEPSTTTPVAVSTGTPASSVLPSTKDPITSTVTEMQPSGIDKNIPAVVLPPLPPKPVPPTPVDQIPPPNIRCVICTRKGGAFKKKDGNRWEHYFCSNHPVPPMIDLLTAVSPPNVVSVVTPGAITPKPVKIACAYCKQKSGALGKCKHPDCMKIFHPLCAALRNNSAYVQSFKMDDNGYCYQYCESHVPAGVMKINPPSGLWLDTELEQKWRKPLDSVLVMVDRIMKREKLKTRFYRNNLEVFEEEAQLLLDNIRGGGMNASVVDSIEACQMIEEFPEDLVPLHSVVTTTVVPPSQPETVPSIPTKKRVGRPPRKDIDNLQTSTRVQSIVHPPERPEPKAGLLTGELVIKVNGQEMVTRDSLQYSDKTEYCREVKNRIMKSMESNSEGTFFVGMRECLAFERNLGSCLKAYLGMSEKDMKAHNFPVMAGDKVLRNEKKRGRFSIDDDSAKETTVESKSILLVPDLTPHSSEIVQHVLNSYGRNRNSNHSASDNKGSSATVAESPVLKRTRHKTAETTREDFGTVFSSRISKISSKKKRATVAEDAELLLNPVELGRWSVVSSPKDVLHMEQVIWTLLNVLMTCEVPASVDPVFCADPPTQQFVTLLGHRLGQGLSLTEWSEWDGELNVQAIEKKLAKQGSKPVVKRQLSSRKSKSSSGYGSEPADDDKKDVGAGGEESSSRMLAEDFEDIPYEVMSAYDTLVLRPLTFNIIQEKLQNHEYVSIYGFARDFYEMLNNGRSITTPGSKTWFDSTVLSGLFEHLLALLEKGDLDSTASPPPVTVVYETEEAEGDQMLLEAANGNGSGCTKECPVCTKMFILSGYPSVFSSVKTKFSRRKSGSPSTPPSEWCWICPACVHALFGALSGYRIKVWWSGDKKYYQGVIEEFDAQSGRYRVQYDGSEWEFIKLEGEGYSLLVPPDRLVQLQAVAVRSNDISGTGSSRSRLKRKSTS